MGVTRPIKNSSGQIIGWDTGSYSVPVSSSSSLSAANGNMGSRGGAVLGAATASGGGSQQKQNGGWYNGVQYWEPGKEPNSGSNNNNNGGGGGGGGEPSQEDLSRQISDLYAPALAQADEMMGSLTKGKDEDLANLNSRYDLTKSQYDQEGQNLLQDTDTEQGKFQRIIESAMSEAVKAYNALRQQRQARFGASSSAGDAIGELAQQEFFRQQGNAQTNLAEGTERFGTEKIRIKQYIDNKGKELTQWKNEAVGALEKQFRDSLAAIQARKNDIEANKTRDKIALLQDAIARARQIKDQDRQLRQEIALAAVNQLQQSSGKTFTPQEWNSFYNEFISGSTNLLPTNVGVTQEAPAAPATKRYIASNTDEYAQTNPYATGSVKGASTGKSWLEQNATPVNGQDTSGYLQWPVKLG